MSGRFFYGCFGGSCDWGLGGWCTQGVQRMQGSHRYHACCLCTQDTIADLPRDEALGDGGILFGIGQATFGTDEQADGAWQGSLHKAWGDR